MKDILTIFLICTLHRCVSNRIAFVAQMYISCSASFVCHLPFFYFSLRRFCLDDILGWCPLSSQQERLNQVAGSSLLFWPLCWRIRDLISCSDYRSFRLKFIVCTRNYFIFSRVWMRGSSESLAKHTFRYRHVIDSSLLSRLTLWPAWTRRLTARALAKGIWAAVSIHANAKHNHMWGVVARGTLWAVTGLCFTRLRYWFSSFTLLYWIQTELHTTLTLVECLHI